MFTVTRAFPNVMYALFLLSTSTIAQETNTIEKPHMMTRWGKAVTAENVWREYPRPQFKRPGKWKSLNGIWRYSVTDTDQRPAKFDGEILVPFAVESRLSGVQKMLQPHQWLWYQRSLKHRTPVGHRTMLHFEAVDYETTVWVNDTLVGTHTGSSDPFSFDITDALKQETAASKIVIKVKDATADDQTLGKQSLTPKGIYYTRVSGIWQSVWIEDVPVRHISRVKLKPRLHASTLRVLPTVSGPPVAGEHLRITASFDGTDVATADAALSLTFDDVKTWTPDHPNLYDIRIELLNGQGSVIDTIQTYAAMREFGIARDDEGHLRLTLNGETIFHYGPLDQGWWPDGLLTPPSEDAMRFDVDYLKAAGFNMIRKHIKVEPRVFYAHCDRIGMLVWQDMPSLGKRTEWTRMKPGPKELILSQAQQDQFLAEHKALVVRLENHPCVAMWVPFNESWGQHNTVGVGRWLENMDVRRPINIASGGNFFPVGDIADHHSYPAPRFPLDDNRFGDFVKVVGEFGGHGFVMADHLWDASMKNYSYGDIPKTRQEYKNRYRSTYQQLMELKDKGIAAGVYTQTTDVEAEINGLMTYDRAVQKLTPEELRDIHAAGDASTPPTHLDTGALLKSGKKIPVIFDSDMGTDIDDTWALLYLLKCPELDLKLVACDNHMGKYRAQLTAKFLEACGRSDIPVALSYGGQDGRSHQQDWVGDYDLGSYSGEVLPDAAEAIINVIKNSPDPVTLICVGAVPNIAEALRRDPTIVDNARFVGMHGSIHVGYGGSNTPVAEANVRVDPVALRKTFTADWNCSITPLDTCGLLNFSGEQYQRIINSNAVGIKPLIDNYEAWLKRVDWLDEELDPKRESSTLFDVVAVYMAYSEEYLSMEDIKIKITDGGMTLLDESGHVVRSANQWKDFEGFKRSVVQRLIQE